MQDRQRAIQAAEDGITVLNRQGYYDLPASDGASRSGGGMGPAIGGAVGGVIAVAALVAAAIFIARQRGKCGGGAPRGSTTQALMGSNNGGNDAASLHRQTRSTLGVQQGSTGGFASSSPASVRV